MSSDSDLSEVESFITQTKAALTAVLQLSFRKTILNLRLRVQTTNKQLTISIFAPRIFRPTCMFTDKEDSGRGFTTVTKKEIQSRNEARIPQTTQRPTTCLNGVHEFGMTGYKRTEHLNMTATLSWNRIIFKTLFNFVLSFWLWKSINQQLRKSGNVAQKKRGSV